jgi:integrase
MYACGLRVSEATTPEISANRVLRIIGKGNKERLVPLPQPVLDELGRLWRTHRNCRWLFPNRHGDAPIILFRRMWRESRLLTHRIRAYRPRTGRFWPPIWGMSAYTSSALASQPNRGERASC